MSAREHLAKIIDQMPEEQVEALRAIAEQLHEGKETPEEERRLWKAAGLRHCARGCGPNEPEYTLEQVKRKP